MNEQNPPGSPKKRRYGTLKLAGYFCAALVFLVVASPRNPATPRPTVLKALDQAHSIGRLLSRYAADHGGKYPEGGSSTEVFQQLIDQGYALDASLFYYPMPGKTPALAKKLRPENVGWDVTCCVDGDSPTFLPVVYLSGYQVNYRPGAESATLPLPSASWSEWWRGKTFRQDFMAVCDHGNSARSLHADYGAPADFIPAGVDLGIRAYRQLTPDGVLPSASSR